MYGASAPSDSHGQSAVQLQLEDVESVVDKRRNMEASVGEKHHEGEGSGRDRGMYVRQLCNMRKPVFTEEMA